MVDFRSHEEKRRDQLDNERQVQQEEGDARSALRRLEPQIEEYKIEVQKLREENRALLEALKTQMQGVEDIKSFLLERMDGLSTDMDQVHRKIINMADDDMRLVKQLGDNQNDRLAKLSAMVTGGNNG